MAALIKPEAVDIDAEVTMILNKLEIATKLFEIVTDCIYINYANILRYLAPPAPRTDDNDDDEGDGLPFPPSPKS